MQHKTGTYVVFNQSIPNYTAHDTHLLVALREEDRDLGEAHFLMDVWHPEKSVLGLYEIVIASRESLGPFALLPNATFLPYQQVVAEARLPLDPQQAMDTAMRVDGRVQDRELTCLVFRPEMGMTSAGYHFYQKRAYWQTGRYESLPVPTLLDALHLYQKARTSTLLLPYHIGLSPTRTSHVRDSGKSLRV